MTKMKLILIAILIGCITSLTGLLLVKQSNKDTKIVKELCYKGQTFVKFNEGRYAWGTTLLDNNGSPVKCNEK